MSNTSLLGSFGGQGNSALMFRNKIINGAMEISQRGNNFTTNGYTLDRWTVFNSGGTFTVSQQTAASGTQPENGMSKFLRIQRTSPSGIFYLEQKIEDVSLYDGFTISVSFYAKANTAIVLPVRVTQEFGSGGSASVIAGTVNVNITSSWAKYTASFTLPSLSGKTIGANSYLALTFDSPATYTTLDITGVQLEAETATPFERRPYSVELSMCQRYYWQSWPAGGTPSGTTSICTSGMQGIVTGGMINSSFILPVEMRIAPNFTVWDHVGTIDKVTRYDPNNANNAGQSGYIVSSNKFFILGSVSGANASQVGAHVRAVAEL